MYHPFTLRWNSISVRVELGSESCSSDAYETGVFLYLCSVACRMTRRFVALATHDRA